MNIALPSGAGRFARARVSPCFSAAIMTLAVALAPSKHLEAAPSADADTRPAMAVEAPAHAVIQSVQSAGKRLVAVGERGLIMLSDDGGASWRQARVPVSVGLTAVRFPTPDQGWAVGHFGTVLHSLDGGENWQVQLNGIQAGERVMAEAKLHAADDEQSAALISAQRMVADGPDKPFLDVYFSDASNGLVVGAYNLILRTVDGGKTWNSLSASLDNPGARHLYSIAAAGGSLYVVGEEGRVYRSDDNGAHFARLQTPYQGSYFTVAAQANEVVIAGLRGNAFHSSDRGQTWNRIELPAQVSVVASSLAAGGSVLLLNQAGQLLQGHTRAHRLAVLNAVPLPPPTGLLRKADGGLLVSSLQGIVATDVPGHD